MPAAFEYVCYSIGIIAGTGSAILGLYLVPRMTSQLDEHLFRRPLVLRMFPFGPLGGRYGTPHGLRDARIAGVVGIVIAALCLWGLVHAVIAAMQRALDVPG